MAILELERARNIERPLSLSSGISYSRIKAPCGQDNTLNNYMTSGRQSLYRLFSLFPLSLSTILAHAICASSDALKLVSPLAVPSPIRGLKHQFNSQQ